MTVPYAPTQFATPVINPAVGGFGAPIPYLSYSQYKFAPTAMDVSNLVPGGSAQENEQSLVDTIRRASRWVDRYCFGAAPAAKGASLCATLSVETAQAKVLNGQLRLVCSYKPIIELTGLDIGSDPSNVAPVANTTAIRIGTKVIYVPAFSLSGTIGGVSDSLTAGRGTSGERYCVWSYVNGYPHTSLASSVTAGTRTVPLVSTAPTPGLYGVYPGTQLTITDGADTESFVVQSLAGATVTTVSPLLFDHTVPASPDPDFIPVTALPDDVFQAAIFLTTALIKTRGDNSLVLQEMTEPHQIQSTAGDVSEDIATAFEMLDDFRSATKQKA